MPDVTPRELLSLAPLLVLVLAVGVYPLLVLRLQEGALLQLVSHVTGR